MVISSWMVTAYLNFIYMNLIRDLGMGSHCLIKCYKLKWKQSRRFKPSNRRSHFRDFLQNTTVISPHRKWLLGLINLARIDRARSRMQAGIYSVLIIRLQVRHWRLQNDRVLTSSRTYSRTNTICSMENLLITRLTQRSMYPVDRNIILRRISLKSTKNAGINQHAT